MSHAIQLRVALLGLLTLGLIGCISGGGSLISVGSPFVVKGTATVLQGDGPCPAWIGDNGVTYHLFQDPLLENEIFDRISEPGTTSRLVLVTRSDLVLSCAVGTIVEVQEVLEIE